MKEGITVLSLFDGMSCGQIALNRVGIKVKHYFASEIDKNAIKVTQYNYPNTIQIGDVKKVSYKDGILYTENGQFKVGHIDLIIGGSPCQDFSALKALTGGGQGLLGGKSGLFYEYLRILKSVLSQNKNCQWLLENVRMKRKSKDELDKSLGVQGICINSSLVSFQNRPRYYWSNIEISPPEDRNISFQDYKEIGNLDTYKLNRTPARERMWSDGLGGRGSRSCANVTNSSKIRCLTTKQDRSPNSGLVEYEDFCRFLTRSELEAAQTVPIGYTSVLSYGQAQAVLGNGWTVDVIAHILNGMHTLFKR